MFIKLVRIGRDAEIKQTPSGTELLEMSVVYDVGYGDNKQGQWLKLAMFGDRAQKLVTHFTKGKQIVVTVDDLKSEAWIKDGEAKSGLSGKLVNFDFVSDGSQSTGQSPKQSAPSHAPQRPAPSYQPPAQQAHLNVTDIEKGWLSLAKTDSNWKNNPGCIGNAQFIARIESLIAQGA